MHFANFSSRLERAPIRHDSKAPLDVCNRASFSNIIYSVLFTLRSGAFYVYAAIRKVFIMLFLIFAKVPLETHRTLLGDPGLESLEDCRGREMKESFYFFS